MQPDYSRQISLPEIGAAGQARLSAARVLVVGAGGLGCPVLQYLAGAGVGRLGIVDADTLDASNLHRQPLYSLADVGRPKAELAAAAIARLNPSIEIAVYPVRFDAENALELSRQFDVLVDCSDNFRTKFLVNDAAVLAGKAAVFASVYQYEGQLQVYKPSQAHACLRCLWPQATEDGIVGNCAEAGVLGPVPGALGTLQALLILKILLDLPGQLAGELRLLNFMDFSQLTLQARRRIECQAPQCAFIHAPCATSSDADLVVSLPSLAAAEQLGLEVIDIRTADELARRPSGARHIAMASLLDDAGQLSVDGRYVLLCASGKRSLASARALRARGYAVQSLAGGLDALEA
jgi:adenylyltransferase/sulfurtransferase